MSRWMVVVGVLVCLGAPTINAQAPARPADPVFVRAQQLVSDGNGAAGRALIDSVIAATPPIAPLYPQALFWRASLAASAADAESDYKHIVVDYPLAPQAAGPPEDQVELHQPGYRGEQHPGQRAVVHPGEGGRGDDALRRPVQQHEDDRVSADEAGAEREDGEVVEAAEGDGRPACDVHRARLALPGQPGVAPRVLFRPGRLAVLSLAGRGRHVRRGLRRLFCHGATLSAPGHYLKHTASRPAGRHCRAGPPNDRTACLIACATASRSPGSRARRGRCRPGAAGRSWWRDRGSSRGSARSSRAAGRWRTAP